MTDISSPPQDPIRPTDDQARALARALIAQARFGALAVQAEGGFPAVTRVAVLADGQGCPVTLVSDLSAHKAALRRDPRAGLLLGEPGPKGDPLTHPRLSLRVLAEFLPRDSAEHGALRALWLQHLPKAKLYIDFADFSFLRLRPQGGALNGGFGRAFRLDAADLAAPPA